MSARSGRAARRTVSILTSTLLLVSLVLAGLMILPTLLGLERYVIISGSMEPTFSVGTIVYGEVVPVEDIEVGDIITFLPPPEYDITTPVTHRVIEVEVAAKGSSHAGERVFRTQGDANEEADPWQMVLDGPDQARVAHHVPYIGYFYMALKLRWVQLLLIGIPALALIVYIVVTLWRVSGDGVREQRAAEATQAAAAAEIDEVAP